MGSINVGHRPDAVRVIYSIIRDPNRLAAFNHRARVTLRETHHLPTTPIWNYLHYRRSLAPDRFDAYHPFWSRLFKREEWWRSHPVTIPALPPETGTTSNPLQPTVPSQPSVISEPPALALSLIALGLLAIWKRGKLWS